MWGRLIWKLPISAFRLEMVTPTRIELVFSP